jgi:hypothetical protein
MLREDLVCFRELPQGVVRYDAPVNRVLGAAAAAAAVILAIVSCTGQTGSGSGAGAAPVSFGRPARDGKFEFTATELLRGPTLDRLGLADRPQTPDVEYVVIRLRVRNISGATKLYSVSAQQLAAGGVRYIPDGLAAVALPNNHPTKDIAKGETLDTTVIFDMPVGTTADTLIVHDTLGSQGASITLTGVPVHPLSSSPAGSGRVVSPTEL